MVLFTPGPSRASETLKQQLPQIGDLYSDFKIICGSETYNVYRLIPHCHSDFFKILFRNNFRENNPDDRHVRLDEYDAIHVKAMVDYLYLAEYKVPPRANPLSFHVNMFAIGAFLMIPDLRREARERLDSEIDTHCPIQWITEMTNTIYALPRDTFHKPLMDSCVRAAVVHLKKVQGRHRLPNFMIRYPDWPVGGNFSQDEYVDPYANLSPTPAPLQLPRQDLLARMVYSFWTEAAQR
jgi:hypothetical protein